MSEVGKIIQALKTNPESVHGLSPRQFEEVVAELLASFGWEVNLTAPSRDGGYDILAVSSDKSGLETSWLIECKKYSSSNKVGVEIARGLLGVKSHIGVPNVVLVTTSDFTAGAVKLSETRHDLHLIGFQRLSSWLSEYGAPPTGNTHAESRSFFSCFISHSHEDEDFAQKLAVHLRREGIRVWFAPEDILPGEKILDQIKQAISAFDKLIIVLSESSMQSSWVKTELLTAFQRERDEDRHVVFPLTLVPFDQVRNWSCFDADSGKDLAAEVRQYAIPDFSNWKDKSSFDSALKKVLTALRASAERQETANSYLQKPHRNTISESVNRTTFNDGDWITAAIVGPEKAVSILQHVVTNSSLANSMSRDEKIEVLKQNTINAIEKSRRQYNKGGDTNEELLEACIAKVVVDILDRELTSFLFEAGDTRDREPGDVYRGVIRKLMKNHNLD